MNRRSGKVFRYNRKHWTVASGIGEPMKRNLHLCSLQSIPPKDIHRYIYPISLSTTKNYSYPYTLVFLIFFRIIIIIFFRIIVLFHLFPRKIFHQKCIINYILTLFNSAPPKTQIRFSMSVIKLKTEHLFFPIKQ